MLLPDDENLKVANTYSQSNQEGVMRGKDIIICYNIIYSEVYW